MCHSGIPKTKFYVLTPFFPQNTFLTELRKFRVKKALTMGTVGTINFKVGKQIDNPLVLTKGMQNQVEGAQRRHVTYF